MTTPSKAVRPCIAYEANDCGYYSQSEADAIFESLEAELAKEKERNLTFNEGVQAVIDARNDWNYFPVDISRIAKIKREGK